MRAFRPSSGTFVGPSQNILHQSDSSFTHYSLAVNRAKFTMDFATLMFLEWKKGTTARIWQLAGLSMAGHILTQKRQEQTLGDQLCDGSQGSRLCDATSHARALPPLLHYLPKINGGFFPNSPRIFKAKHNSFSTMTVTAI
jgi:hypothetical protein